MQKEVKKLKFKVLKYLAPVLTAEAVEKPENKGNGPSAFSGFSLKFQKKFAVKIKGQHGEHAWGAFWLLREVPSLPQMQLFASW